MAVAGRRKDGGMDLTYPPEAEQFRKEIRAWLEENLPDGWFDEGFSMTADERAEFHRSWSDKLFEGGWICASWPTEYGGKGLSVIENVVLNEEFAAAGAPMRADFFGDTLVGPTILQWGTEEQKQEFLPKILKGEISWCQGFSEPNAGSDLAGLKTTAVLDGDEWIINGQKVWTTQALHADYVFLLARTDPDAPKHKGISYLLVPMKQPGVEVRPIVQPDGSAEFNEVFFTDVRAPVENVVGGVNNGWKVAMTTLGFERGASATTSHRRFAKELDHILELAQAQRQHRRPVHPAAVRAAVVPRQHPADQRSADAVGHAPRHEAGGGARPAEQDDLVRNPPRHDGAGARRARHAGPDPHRLRLRRRVRAGLRRAPRPRRLPGVDPAGELLLQPVRDDLGWDGGDPAQHRRRAGPRAARRKPGGSTHRAEP